ncbi:MAG: hypothetical protein ACJ74Z_22270 [Bryobacteraceae bacterium]
MPKSKDPNFAASPGDIIMFVVENRYHGKHSGAPRTPYLLIVQALNEERSILMIRVLGISAHAKNSLEKEYVPLIETDSHMESRLNEYYSIDWEQVGKDFQPAATGPVSTMVH